MKRSDKKYLQAMRDKQTGWFSSGVKLAAIAAGAYALQGCNSEDAYIYKDAYDCSLDNPGEDMRCESAYRRALADWQDSAPRYTSLGDCEYDFGNSQCQEFRPHFIPLMAGFMLGRNYASDDDFDLDFDRPRGLTSSYSRRSPAFNRWVGSNGNLYGNYGKQRVKVSKSTFKGTKGRARVMGRGGFGRTVSSRSSGG